MSERTAQIEAVLNRFCPVIPTRVVSGPDTPKPKPTPAKAGNGNGGMNGKARI